MCLSNVLKTISNILVAASFPSVSVKQDKSVKLWTALKKKIISNVRSPNLTSKILLLTVKEDFSNFLFLNAWLYTF